MHARTFLAIHALEAAIPGRFRQRAKDISPAGAVGF
jgi:hypothetical protein